MGCCSSKAAAGNPDAFITKQAVTLWKFSDKEGAEPESHYVAQHQEVAIKNQEQKWWQVKSGSFTGYAAKFYFVPANTKNDWEKQPWYFGDVSRDESEAMLKDMANPDGAYLVRYSDRSSKFVLDVKFYSTKENSKGFIYKHFEVKRGESKQEYYFVKSNKFKTLPALINYCMNNKEENLPTKLTNVCLIPNPHSDPEFIHYKEDVDSRVVPITELSYDKDNMDMLGSGQFGIVFKAKYRGKLDVAVKQLKLGEGDNVSKAESEKALQEFLDEYSTMTKLNHPNLVQLFAVVIDETVGNFMIQEFMAKGDLKNHLKKLKDTRDRPNFQTLLSWCAQVSRGMSMLEEKQIVHRDLAARNVLLDKFDRAKVADFGLALEGQLNEGEKQKLPVKWTAPEAMFRKKFSHESDVWAYGIMMWEVFSFGETPYPGTSNREYKSKMNTEYKKTKEGKDIKDRDKLRCPIPEAFKTGADKENMEKAFKVMNNCWDMEPQNRPKFAVLSEDLSQAVEGDWEGYFNNYDDNDH